MNIKIVLGALCAYSPTWE